MEQRYEITEITWDLFKNKREYKFKNLNELLDFLINWKHRDSEHYRSTAFDIYINEDYMYLGHKVIQAIKPLLKLLMNPEDLKRIAERIEIHLQDSEGVRGGLNKDWVYVKEDCPCCTLLNDIRNHLINRGKSDDN